MNDAEMAAEEQRRRAMAGNPVPPIPGQATGGVVPSFSVTTTQDPSSSTTRIKRDAGIINAESAIDEAKQARLDAVAAQAEADREAELNAGLQASAQADALKAENDRLSLAESDRKKRLEELDAMEAAQQAAVDKAARPTGYFQDMSTMGKILMAVSLGSAAAVGAREPFEVYKNYQAEDRQRKMDILKAETEKLARISGDRNKANEYFDREAARISREEIANGKIVAAQITAASKKFPQSAAKAQQAVAQILDDTATKSLEHSKEMAAKVTSQSKQRSVSTTEGKPDPGANKAPTEAESKFGLMGFSIKDDIERIRKGAPLTSDDLDKLQSNTLGAEAADNTAEKGQLQSLAIRAGRWAGVTPKSRYEGLSPEKQITANAYDNVMEKLARAYTGAGMPEQEARRKAREAIPAAGDSPQAAEVKLIRAEAEANRFIALAGPKAQERLAGINSNKMGKQTESEQQPAHQRVDMGKKLNAKELKSLSSVEVSRYAKAMRIASNPNDPNRERALNVVRAIESKARGGE